MKITAIGDNALIMFLENAGISGTVATSQEHAKTLFLDAVKDSSVSVIILSEKLSRYFQDDVTEANLSGDRIVFCFPDTSSTEANIAQKIMSHLGVNLS